MAGVFQRFCDDYGVKPYEVALIAVVAVFLALVAWQTTDAWVAMVLCYLAFTMLLITIIDSRVMLIPDVLSLPAIPAGLIAAMVIEHRGVTDVLWDHGLAALIASGFLFVLRASYLRLRGVEGLGLGDVKLAAAAGAWVGLEMLSVTCLLATCGALVAVAMKSFAGGNTLHMKIAIPFGSFIALAILLSWTTKVLLK
jgi:leader peptidase (prepilin peptidase) / N-methyltransferase